MLDKLELETILRDWSYWDKIPSSSVSRRILAKIPTLQPDIVLVIQGVRRCGKSTLLSQLMSHFNLSSESCIFVNFEDPRLSDHLTFQLLEDIVDLGKSIFPSQKKRYFFFDEIQNVEHWEKWLHAKTAKNFENHFIITGSNASLLSGDLATALTGRHLTVELFPFDFQEFLLLKPNADIVTYLELGGFPRALTFAQPKDLLREYFQDIIERDVRRNLATRKSIVLTQLAKAVFDSTGSEISQRKLAAVLDISIDTVGQFLQACEAAYLILCCPYFTFSERQRVARSRKYYPIDVGIKNAISTRAKIDIGKNFETLVFHELRRRYYQVCFWRKSGEVDFVIQTEKGITPIQVSWNAMQPRHENALKEFYSEFPDSQKAVLVTNDNFSAFVNGDMSL